MKRNFVRIVAIAGVLAGGSLSSLAADLLTVNVPFSFSVAGQEFQPGHYVISDQDSNGVITVMGEGRGAVVMAAPGEADKSSAHAALDFVTNGREHRLVAVRTVAGSSRIVDSQANSEHKLTTASR